jgi:hypothetical protein
MEDRMFFANQTTTANVLHAVEAHTSDQRNFSRMERVSFSRCVMKAPSATADCALLMSDGRANHP